MTPSPPTPDAAPDESVVPRNSREQRAAAAARRARTIRRQRLAAAGLLAAVLAVAAAIAASTDGGHGPRSGTRQAATRATTHVQPPPATKQPGPSAHRRASPFPVGLRTLKLVDRSRRVHPSGGAPMPRGPTTYVRYPASAPASASDLRGARPATGAGPFPLIVFGHGFAVTPSVYSRLLRAWARAGYVVAAPVFPLENANASGGPDESDLVNQPRDMRFVISALLAQSAGSGTPLSHLIDPSQVAVAGQSDGGETALAVAYNKYFRDRRVRAAAILSGAVIPGVGGFTFAPGSPPLLATQGTADKLNRPSSTQAYFARARRPKYLLELLGASHLPPYSGQQPQLGIVERVTTAFFDLYLKRTPGAQRRITTQGSVRGISSLSAHP